MTEYTEHKDVDAPVEVFEKNAFDEYANFLVHSDLEKARIFRDIRKAGTMVTMYFAGGSDFILTTVLCVDLDRRVVAFELGPDPTRNRRLMESGRVTGVTTHNQVKVQFICDSIKSCRYQGEEALCCEFPDRMLRLQRRETYRQTVPKGMRIVCNLRLEDGRLLDLDLVDISSGGLCLADETGRLDLPPTTLIPRCTVVIPEHGTIETTLEVRNRHRVTLLSGKEIQHIGCRFVTLPARMNAVIQRFIVAVDRERRRFSTGRS